MGSGFAPRFAVEAAFLVLLAVAAGFADLETWQIALVMAAGWLVVTTIEWLAWRADRRLEEQLSGWGAGAGHAAEAEAQHGWDPEEILAPLPEDAGEGEAFTSVIPPDDRP